MPGLDVGEHPEQRVLARPGIDMDAIADDPGEELRFGMHGPELAVPPVDPQAFCRTLGSALRPLPFLPPAWSQALAGCPDWLAVAIGVVVAVVALWILGKLIKWTLYLLLFLLLAGAAGFLIWLAWQALFGVPVPPPGP